MTAPGPNPPSDFMAKARPKLEAFAKSAGTPVVIPSTVPLSPATLAAAKHALDGICPGGTAPVCPSMARAVVVLMTDGTAVPAILVIDCQCQTFS